MLMMIDGREVCVSSASMKPPNPGSPPPTMLAVVSEGAGKSVYRSVIGSQLLALDRGTTIFVLPDAAGSPGAIRFQRMTGRVQPNIVARLPWAAEISVKARRGRQWVTDLAIWRGGRRVSKHSFRLSGHLRELPLRVNGISIESLVEIRYWP